VARKLKKAERLVAGLEARAAAADDVESVRRDGELLKACLGRIARGATSIEVDDWFTGAKRAIALDPKLSPLENVERVFARAKKLVRAKELVAGELVEARARLARLRSLAASVDDPDTDPEALEREAVEEGLLDPAQIADPRRKKTPAPRQPYRTFTTPQGGTVLVGRSARDNDELTIRHSKGSDLWLHTAEAPGSHVVLRLDRGAQPDPEELLDAAHLAAHFSPLKGARKVAVHVAARKLVHKPKGAKPGLVTLSGGKVLALRVQPERLKRLLGPG
jgi:predicted ribosome quality control (RQC) complex YloA/Tae2 family protein